MVDYILVFGQRTCPEWHTFNNTSHDYISNTLINYFDKQISHSACSFISVTGLSVAGPVQAAGWIPGRPYLGQKHGQSHDEVLCQFVLIVYLGLPLLCCQHLEKQTQNLRSNVVVGVKIGRERAMTRILCWMEYSVLSLNMTRKVIHGKKNYPFAISVPYP